MSFPMRGHPWDANHARQTLLPKWLQGLCWGFMLRAGALPFVWLFAPATAQFRIFGLYYVGSPFDMAALQLQGIYFALGFTAYGLLWARPWGVDAGIACTVIGLAVCAVTTLIAGFHMIRLVEPLLLAPFLMALLRIRREWHDLSPWRSGASALLVAVVTCVGVAFVFGPPRMDAPWGWHRTESSDQTPVTVLVLGSAKKVAQVRAAVGRGEVVAESAGAFALRRRRVVAASYEDVGPLVTRAGWQEAPIALWAPTRELPPQTRGAVPSSSDGGLGDLINKPSLSELEVQRLLDLLLMM